MLSNAEFVICDRSENYILLTSNCNYENGRHIGCSALMSAMIMPHMHNNRFNLHGKTAWFGPSDHLM